MLSLKWTEMEHTHVGNILKDTCTDTNTSSLSLLFGLTFNGMNYSRSQLMSSSYRQTCAAAVRLWMLGPSDSLTLLPNFKLNLKETLDGVPHCLLLRLNVTICLYHTAHFPLRPKICCQPANTWQCLFGKWTEVSMWCKERSNQLSVWMSEHFYALFLFLLIKKQTNCSDSVSVSAEL